MVWSVVVWVDASKHAYAYVGACVHMCMCVAGARVRRRAFWPPIPTPPMRRHVGTTRCRGPFFFGIARRGRECSTTTALALDDAEGDDDDHANGCFFGRKFDTLTRYAERAGGRCNMGVVHL